MKILLVLLISFQVLAQVKVEKDFAGRFFLEGQNCEKVTENYEAIIKWNQYRKTPISQDILNQRNECSCLNQKCKLEITSILPEEISALNGVCTIYSGPNCFNTALNDQKILNRRRMVKAKEVKFLITSELCKEVPAGEKPKAGSMIVISQDEDFPLHGFTYVSDDLVFSKGGPSKDAKYELTSYESMFTLYEVPKECWHVNGNPDQSVCPKYANVYNCKSFEEYRAEKPIKNKELRELFSTFDGLECSAEKHIFKHLLGIGPSVALLKSSLQMFRMKIIDNRDDPNLSPQENFYWNMAWYKFLGIEEQLDRISE